MTDDLEPNDIIFKVRTLGADGEFELLSSDEVARRLETTRGESPLSILALSSGGASGAFGAGALVGWTSRGTRPDFSVVTGVSAGALVAPLVFLGSSWDERMTAIFTTGVTDGLLQPRGLAALFGSSVYSAEPLRRLIQQYADDAMIDAIAREAAKGRLLLVATTDFATGDAVIWDLGSIALYGGKNAKPLLQSVLLASASVPGMLPPVVLKVRTKGSIHEETHVDGGVTLPFFIAPAPEDLPRATAPSAQPAAVHVVINGPLRDVPRRTHANALSVFTRSLSAGLSHTTRTTLELTAAAVHQRGIRSITRRYRLHIHYAVTSTSVQIRNARSLNLPQAAPKRSVSGCGFTRAATSARLSGRQAPKPRSARPMTRSSRASLRSGTETQADSRKRRRSRADGRAALTADQLPPAFVSTCNAASPRDPLFVPRLVPTFDPCVNIQEHNGERAWQAGGPHLNGTRHSCSFFPAAACFPSLSGPTGTARGS